MLGDLTECNQLVVCTADCVKCHHVTSLHIPAELGVKQQADHVRHLKEVEGLTKDDPVLDAAVSELLQRKQALQNLQ